MVCLYLLYAVHWRRSIKIFDSVDWSASPFESVSFCFMNFDVPLLGTYLFRVSMSSWETYCYPVFFFIFYNNLFFEVYCVWYSCSHCSFLTLYLHGFVSPFMSKLSASLYLICILYVACSWILHFYLVW